MNPVLGGHAPTQRRIGFGDGKWGLCHCWFSAFSIILNRRDEIVVNAVFSREKVLECLFDVEIQQEKTNITIVGKNDVIYPMFLTFIIHGNLDEQKKVNNQTSKHSRFSISKPEDRPAGNSGKIPSNRV